jgi:Fe-S-cluster containining protein
MSTDREITCATCKACCCRLEVMLMGDDAPPERFIETDRWGGQVMARLADGLCAALDRDTHLCTIYAQRPTVCRDFAMGGDDCLTERSAGLSLRRAP